MNSIQDSNSAALQGIQKNLKGFQEQAREVAQASVDDRNPMDLASNVVRSVEHSRAIEASAESLKRSDEALGTLLDVLA